MQRICSNCGRLVDKGKRCVCQIERAAKADMERGSPASRGYDAEWQALRKLFITANPMCLLCGKPAKHVDHIQTIREAPQRRLDPTNLRSLCHPCHSSHTASSLPFGVSAVLRKGQRA